MSKFDMNYLLLLIPLGFVTLFLWATFSLRRQILKDWATLEYLKKRTNQVSTKEEIEKFHKEFVEKANKIHNSCINPELQKIDGYLRGLYKQLD